MSYSTRHNCVAIQIKSGIEEEKGSDKITTVNSEWQYDSRVYYLYKQNYWNQQVQERQNIIGGAIC